MIEFIHQGANIYVGNIRFAFNLIATKAHPKLPNSMSTELYIFDNLVWVDQKKNLTLSKNSYGASGTKGMRP